MQCEWQKDLESFPILESPNNPMNTADPIKRITDSRTQQYWTSISSSISNTTNRLRVTIFNPPLPPSVVEKTIEVKTTLHDFHKIDDRTISVSFQ